MLIKTKDILKSERIIRRLTQQDVADKLHMSRGTYAQYETGAVTPTTENIVKLSELYNLPVDYLLGTKFGEYAKRSYKQGTEIGEGLAEETLKNKRVRKSKEKPRNA